MTELKLATLSQLQWHLCESSHTYLFIVTHNQSLLEFDVLI